MSKIAFIFYKYSEFKNCDTKTTMHLIFDCLLESYCEMEGDFLSDSFLENISLNSKFEGFTFEPENDNDCEIEGGLLSNSLTEDISLESRFDKVFPPLDEVLSIECFSLEEEKTLADYIDLSRYPHEFYATIYDCIFEDKFLIFKNHMYRDDYEGIDKILISLNINLKGCLLDKSQLQTFIQEMIKKNISFILILNKNKNISSLIKNALYEGNSKFLKHILDH
jgi:hypothetical protein